MTKQTEELLRLIKENPDLPIVPMVDHEVCGDGYAWWLGNWGRSEVTEYYIGEKKIHFKDDDEEDVLADMMDALYKLHSGRIAPAIVDIVLAVALIVAVIILWRNAA